MLIWNTSFWINNWLEDKSGDFEKLLLLHWQWNSLAESLGFSYEWIWTSPWILPSGTSTGSHGENPRKCANMLQLFRRKHYTWLTLFKEDYFSHHSSLWRLLYHSALWGAKKWETMFSKNWDLLKKTNKQTFT